MMVGSILKITINDRIIFRKNNTYQNYNKPVPRQLLAFLIAFFESFFHKEINSRKPY